MTNRTTEGHTGSSMQGSTATAMADWSTEESYWRETWSSRPYAKADRGFDFYAPAYRYGSESAMRYTGRSWNDVEKDLKSGWTSYEHRGKSLSTWEEIKDAVKDGWNRMLGRDRNFSSTDSTINRNF